MKANLVAAALASALLSFAAQADCYLHQPRGCDNTNVVSKAPVTPVIKAPPPAPVMVMAKIFNR